MAKDSALGEECVQWKVCTGGPFDQDVLVCWLIAPGDVDTWVILIKRFIDMSLSATSTIRSRTAFSLARSYAHLLCGPLAWERFYPCRDYGRNAQTMVMTITRPRRLSWMSITISIRINAVNPEVR